MKSDKSMIIFLIFILISAIAGAQADLNQIIADTARDQRLVELEQKRQTITGNSLREIAARSQIDNQIETLKQEKSRRLLQQAIEGTNTSQMASENTQSEQHRLRPRQGDLGSATLNQVVDNTVAESNPAVAGRQTPAGRPLVLYRDVDPSDVFTAKEFGKADPVVVYKSTDLKGRTVYKTLDGNVTNAVIQGKLFPKEDVIYQDTDGKLQKGTPRAIYPDGTLEIKESSGVTTRRAPGTYHLSDNVGSVRKGQIQTYSGKTVSPYQDLDSRADLSDRERKALKALQNALCNM